MSARKHLCPRGDKRRVEIERKVDDVDIAGALAVADGSSANNGSNNDFSFKLVEKLI